MPSETVSILDVIKKGDLSASLFTTFNANLKFYEDFVLRRLTAAGSRNNVLVMDKYQCALACSSAATRPCFAGIGYTLVPVGVSGAFHPKVCLLAGKKRASLFVGSHNLTISGFGYNREVTCHLEMMGAPGSPERNALMHAWSIVRGWLALDAKRLPEPLLESAYALDQAFGILNPAVPDGEDRLLAQQPGAAGLLDQLATFAPQKVIRITVIGAFFDHDGRFLQALAHRWPDAQIIVGVEPATTWMPSLPKINNLKIVDVGDLGVNKTTGYLHAKALYMEGENGRGVFASGSANPSAPAWFSTESSVNVEAMLVRVDSAARTSARALGIEGLKSLTKLNDAKLAKLLDRSKKTPLENVAGVMPVFVGVADHGSQQVVLDWTDLPVFDQIDALDDVHQPLPGVALNWSVPGHVGVPDDIFRVRSLILRKGNDAVARVLVHHPAVIARHVQGSSREPAADLLRELGSEMEDISRVLPLLERVIFSDSLADVLRIPAPRSAGHRAGDTTVARPDTLGVSLADVQRKRTTSLFCASHDIAYLIDILVNHIDISESPHTRGFDRIGRSEEEQIGQDDEDILPTRPKHDAERPNDAKVGDAVCRRISKLCKRMTKALDQAERTPEGTAKSLVQLIAVLALLQELSRLELSDRWRIARIPLFWLEDMEPMLDVAFDSLFGAGGEISKLIQESSQTPEEVGQLVSLMLWAAWLLDLEWCTSSGNRLVADDTEDKAIGNARLLGLLTLAGDNDDWWSDAKRHIERTLPLDSSVALATTRWFERHVSIARKLVTLSEAAMAGPLKLPSETIVPGDIVSVPAVVDGLLVAISSDGRFVEVMSDQKRRKFLADRVSFLARF